MLPNSPPCLHIVAASSTVCDLCHKVVPAKALRAARLRSQRGTEASTLPTLVDQGVSTHTIVKGDHVAEVVLWVRPRDDDDAALTTHLVAEVTGGVGLEAVGLHVGLVVEVKTQGVVLATTEQRREGSN